MKRAMKSPLLIVLLVGVNQLLALDPGIKIRIGKRGLEYVNRVVESNVNERLQSFVLDDVEDYTGNPQYSLKNIQITKVPKITSVMSFKPDGKGLTLLVNDYDVEISTDYWAKHTVLFVPFTLEGRVTATFIRVSVSTTIVIDVDGSSIRRPLMRSEKCSANIGDVRLKFEGRAAWLLNLLKGLFTNRVSNLIKGKICGLVNIMINEKGADVLKKARLTHEIGNLYVDYSLTAPVSSTSKYLESKHKGEVSWVGDKSPILIKASPIPDKDPDSNFMAEIVVSKYSVSTLAYVAHQQNFLNLDVSPGNLPADKKPFLRTTCPGSFCVGSIISLIGEKYPDSMVSFKVNSPVSPQITISTDGLSLQMTTFLDLFAEIGDSSLSIIHCEMVLSLNGAASVENDLISGKIDSVSVRVSNVQTLLGNLSTDVLNDLVKRVLNLNFIPNLNNILAIGIPLPTIPDMTMTKSKLKYFDGFFAIAGDYSYANIV